jgi:hypothetical protein
MYVQHILYCKTTPGSDQGTGNGYVNIYSMCIHKIKSRNTPGKRKWITLWSKYHKTWPGKDPGTGIGVERIRRDKGKEARGTQSGVWEGEQ